MFFVVWDHCPERINGRDIGPERLWFYWILRKQQAHSVCRSHKNQRVLNCGRRMKCACYHKITASGRATLRLPLVEGEVYLTMLVVSSPSQVSSGLGR